MSQTATLEPREALTSTAPEAPYREVRYEHSTDFPALLAHLGVSLLVSTYQAGKLAVVSAAGSLLSLKFHNFDQPMGLAVGPGKIAVGTRRQVWFLAGAPDVAHRIEPAGQHDGCFLARSCHVTGEIHGHEMAWAGEELWIVNTLFSCLSTLDARYSFVPRWKPPFITALAAEDRCHLNGLAVVDGRPKYVTALGQTDAKGGWRPGKASGGCLLDVDGGAVVIQGLCMPHSPRVHDGRLWLLDSGRGRLVTVDPQVGRCETAAELPGYCRGLAFAGPYAFVGLSKIRESSTFGGIPVAERRQELKCGVWVVNWRTGQPLMFLELQSGVEEIFDVQVLPGMRSPVVEGPHSAEDGGSTIWTVPSLPEVLLKG
jgi:uncharacterized protein (TIGR03032 family)